MSNPPKVEVYLDGVLRTGWKSVSIEGMGYTDERSRLVAYAALADCEPTEDEVIAWALSRRARRLSKGDPA